MKRIVYFVCLLLFGVNYILAQSVVIDGIEYTRSGANTADCRVAKNLSKSVTSLDILAQVNINRVSCDVTRIEDEGFKGCQYLYEITIPESVGRIGKKAFEGCAKLRTLVVPNSVKYIG